jgi:hypothetical protein
MPLGEDEPIPVGPIRLLRPYPEFVEVQSGQDIGLRQRAAQMAHTGLVDGTDDLDPNASGDLL